MQASRLGLLGPAPVSCPSWSLERASHYGSPGSNRHAAGITVATLAEGRQGLDRNLTEFPRANQ